MAYRRMLESAVALLDNRRVRLVAQGLLLATIVFVVIRLRSLWSDNTLDLARISWGVLVGAVILTAAGVGASGFIWLEILRRLGLQVRWRWVAVFFQAQLAKYIPGAVWQYAGRATLARSRGIPIRAVAISLPIEIVASLAAAVALAPLLLGWWGLPIAVVVLLGMAIAAGRLAGPARFPRGTVSATIGAAVLYVGVWLSIGAGFWLTARALVGAPARDLLVYIGALTVAWAVGLLAVYAPGGIGVREAVLVALLRGRLSAGDALVVASAFRVVMTFVDVAAAGATVLVLRHREESDSLPDGAVRDLQAASE